MRMCHLCAFDRNDDTAERCRQCGADLEPLEENEDENETESAWFHYLQIQGIGTIELVPGRAFRFGKDPRNELVIPRASADVVASMFWTDDYDEATIEDKGSSEGTKVEGVRVSGVRTLKGGEDIELGTFRMSYLRRASQIEGAIDARKAATPSAGAGAGARIAVPSPKARTGDRRRSVGASPAEVARALEVSKKSGTLRVTGDSARGWLTVVGGSPRHAAFGGLTGKPALLAILRLSRGRCNMTQGVSARGVGPRLEVSISQALAEIAAARGATTGRTPTGRPPAPTGRTPAPQARPGMPAPTPRPRPGAPLPPPRSQPSPRPGQRPPPPGRGTPGRPGH